jgi:predicted dehydrogenase
MIVDDSTLRVAIVGCGSMGQGYADAYAAYPDTEIVAIAEYNSDRRKAVGEQYGVRALFADVESLLREVVPDVVAVVTPSKYMKDAVLACAEAGVKGVSTDKPIAARLSDADEMVETCRQRGVVYAGGNLQVSADELQQVANRLAAGEFGEPIGCLVENWGAGEISGGGCQQICLLRRLTGTEIEEVIAWADPPESLEGESDENLRINGRFRLSNGVECPVSGIPQASSNVYVWTADTLIRATGGTPDIFRGFDESGKRIQIDPAYEPYRWNEFGYLTGSIRSFLSAVRTGSPLRISGDDLRIALEVAIAAKLSAQRGSAPVKLPLEDRSLTLFPRPYRWEGGDATDGEDRKTKLLFK